jgi:SAM-dependent methyltransferase
VKTDAGFERHRTKQLLQWETAAKDPPGIMARHYHRRLRRYYRFNIPPGLRVLELGCGTGDLLAALEPRYGVGIDVSPGVIEAARQRHPGLIFEIADAHEFRHEEKFDAVILSDLIGSLYDVQAVLERVKEICKPDGRVIMNFFSHLWQKPLDWAGALGLARPVHAQNWLTPDDVVNLLYLAGLEPIRRWTDFIFPLPVPFIEPLFNRYLAKLWPTYALCLANFVIARPRPVPRPLDGPEAPSVTVVIPVRNEAGNAPQFFTRVPRMGSHTELVIVEGHSTDDSYEAIRNAIRMHPEWDARLYRQTGVGKGDAVRLGFAQARGDVLMILDADLTVAPEDLPRFYAALVQGRGEFINGVRLVYPMEGQAMRFLNLLGNKFFSLAFSWLLGQRIKDTLCGTKVLYRSDYEKIAANRSYFGDFDPFGDYDLIFGADRLCLKIVDMPIRYRSRTYGDTNIRRWSHGWLLLKMVFFAARRIRFI